MKVLVILPRFLLLATLAMNTNGESYVIWNLRLSNLWHPAPPHVSSLSPEAISDTPLCKQEFVLQEATVGMGLEVRIYTPVGKVLSVCMNFVVKHT